MFDPGPFKRDWVWEPVWPFGGTSQHTNHPVTQKEKRRGCLGDLVQANNDHEIVTFTSYTMRRPPAGCPALAGSKRIIQVRGIYIAKNPSSPRCCFASHPFLYRKHAIDAWLLMEDKGWAGERPVCLLWGFWWNLFLLGCWFFLFVCFFQGLWVMLSASQRREILHILPVWACVCALPYTAHSLCSLTPMAI